jgi:hypothetical protein
VASHAGGNAEEWHNVWVPGHETERAVALNIVASELWTVAQAGRVALTQRRRAPLVCDYVATLKSNSPAASLAVLGSAGEATPIMLLMGAT